MRVRIAAPPLGPSFGLTQSAKPATRAHARAISKFEFERHLCSCKQIASAPKAFALRRISAKTRRSQAPRQFHETSLAGIYLYEKGTRSIRGRQGAQTRERSKAARACTAPGDQGTARVEGGAQIDDRARASLFPASSCLRTRARAIAQSFAQTCRSASICEQTSARESARAKFEPGEFGKRAFRCRYRGVA